MEVLGSAEALRLLLMLGTNPYLLGLAVFGMVSSVKRAVESDQRKGKPAPEVSPWVWRGLAVGFALFLSFAFYLATGTATLGAGWKGVPLFGFVAAITSIIGRDAFKTVASWFGLGAAQGQPMVEEDQPAEAPAPLPRTVVKLPDPGELRPALPADLVPLAVPAETTGRDV